jgi:hypothetical protein
MVSDFLSDRSCTIGQQYVTVCNVPKGCTVIISDGVVSASQKSSNGCVRIDISKLIRLEEKTKQTEHVHSGEKTKMKFSEAEIFEAIARGWCYETNSSKTMDPLLGEAIAVEILKVVRPLVEECRLLDEECSILARECVDMERCRNNLLEQNEVLTRKLTDIVCEDKHFIEFREDGWTIQHPLSCRPNLFNCPVNKAAVRDLKKLPEERLGFYVCGLDREGMFWYDRDSYSQSYPVCQDLDEYTQSSCSEASRLLDMMDMRDLAPVLNLEIDDWTYADYHSETNHKHPTIPEYVDELNRRLRREQENE